MNLLPPVPLAFSGSGRRFQDDWCVPLTWLEAILSEARTRKIALRGIEWDENRDCVEVRPERLLARAIRTQSIAWIRQCESRSGILTVISFSSGGESWGYWTAQPKSACAEDRAWRLLLLETLVLASRTSA